MGGLTVTELNSFSGGMDNVTASYLIPKDEATLLANVDIRRGAMQSVNTPIWAMNAQDSHFFQFNKTVRFFPTWRSNVVWDNKLYWSDGVTTGKVLADGTELPLGLPTPTTILVGDPTNPGIHEGDFKYAYTFYDTETGTESAPSGLSLYITATENSISLSGFDALPEHANMYRLYRIGGYLPYFMLVDTFGDINYEDNLDDTQIDGRMLDTLRNGPPPNGLKYLTELNGRLYGSVENNVFFSALGNPDSWYVYDFIPFQNTIRGIAKAPGGLLVMGLHWTSLLKGGDPLSFSLRSVSDEVGITGAESIAYADTSAIWLSEHGIVTSDGYTMTQLTADKIENITGLIPTGAMTLNNVYYLAYKPDLVPQLDLYPSDTLFPSQVQGLGGVDQGILSLDFKRGRGYSYKILDVPEIESLGALNGKVGIIHGLAENFAECDEIGFPDCLSFIKCIGYELAYLSPNLREVAGELGSFDTLQYMSPAMVDGSTTTLKEYDKVRILFKGTFSITILFDNDRVIVERQITSYVNEKFEFALLGIPNGDNKSYSIRFFIHGRGVINGIQYSWKNRELA